MRAQIRSLRGDDRTYGLVFERTGIVANSICRYFPRENPQPSRVGRTPYQLGSNPRRDVRADRVRAIVDLPWWQDRHIAPLNGRYPLRVKPSAVQPKTGGNRSPMMHAQGVGMPPTGKYVCAFIRSMPAKQQLSLCPHRACWSHRRRRLRMQPGKPCPATSFLIRTAIGRPSASRPVLRPLERRQSQTWHPRATRR